MRSTPRLFLRSCAVFFASAMIASTYGASSVPSYTVTDLGVGTPLISSTGADGTLTTSSGTVYAFPRTDNSVANPVLSLIPQLPALYNPYASTPSNGSGGEDLHYYYREYTNGPAFLNQNGVAVDTELDGVSGHINLAGSNVDTYQRQADGSFAPTPFGSGAYSPNNRDTGGIIATALDLNNRNQLLSETAGFGGGSPVPYQYPVFLLANLNTGTVTNLQDLLPAGWHIDYGQMALDDQGRILVYADQPSVYQSTGVFQEHALLLTPAGLTSNPIPAPEPTTFVMLAVVGIGLAVRRRWKS
jgi:hypothetical protein